MSNLTSHRESGRKSNPLIDRLLRQKAADGSEAVPASVYEAEDAHWAANYATRPYVDAGEDYEDYAPAYLYGVYLYHSNPDKTFDDDDSELANGWESAGSDSPLDWQKAKPAVEEAWYRSSDLEQRAQSERAAVLASSDTHTPGDH